GVGNSSTPPVPCSWTRASTPPAWTASPSRPGSPSPSSTSTSTPSVTSTSRSCATTWTSCSTGSAPRSSPRRTTGAGSRRPWTPSSPSPTRTPAASGSSSPPSPATTTCVSNWNGRPTAASTPSTTSSGATPVSTYTGPGSSPWASWARAGSAPGTGSTPAGRSPAPTPCPPRSHCAGAGSPRSRASPGSAPGAGSAQEAHSAARRLPDLDVGHPVGGDEIATALLVVELEHRLRLRRERGLDPLLHVLRVHLRPEGEFTVALGDADLDLHCVCPSSRRRATRRHRYCQPPRLARTP